MPSSQEQGLPGVDTYFWSGFLYPKGTPDAIVRKLNADIVAAMSHPPVKALLEKLGADLVGSSPDGLRQFLQVEMDKWGPLIRDANITVNE